MPLGNSVLANVLLGNSVARVPSSVASELLETHKQTLHHPWPWLTLWDVELPDGSTRYYCDFGDPDARSAGVPSYVTFRSNEYTTVSVARTDYPQDQESQGSVTVTFHDPLRSVLSVFSDNNMDGQRVTMWVTRYDLLASGEDEAIKTILRVQAAVFAGPPDTVAVTLGMPNLFVRTFPPVRYNRRRCGNDFQRRFVETNPCTYGSEEFEASTEQDVAAAASSDAETTLQHGLFVLNGSSNVQDFETNRTTASDDPYDTVSPDAPFRVLKIHVNGANHRWDDTNQNGPFLYRVFGDVATHETDFDVYVKLRTWGAVTKVEWQMGILCQSVDDTADWIYWALAEDAATAFQYRSRVTTNDVSVDDDTAAGATHEACLRMERVGSTWILYTRDEDWDTREVSTASWTLRQTKTLAITGAVRLGVFAASDHIAGGGDLFAEYAYMRMLSGGGYTTCDRSLGACRLRFNEPQFNGFLGMPDGRTFVR